MKISAYQKSLGNSVKLITAYKDLFSRHIKLKQGEDPTFGFLTFDDVSEKGDVLYYREEDIKYNKIYISKVFTDTRILSQLLYLNNPNTVEYGGTGFFYDKAPSLSPEIEHIKPDYHLYDEWVAQKLLEGVKPKELTYYTDYSIGFMTRGCIRQCSFCVNKNYRKCSSHSPLSEFLENSRPYICVLDDNVFACKDWRSVFNELQTSGKRFQFKQGMDERLLTDEKCEIIFNKSKWIGDYIFAFDNIKDAKIIEDKLQLIRKHTDKIPKFYLFCGFNHDNPDHYSDEFWTKDIEDAFKRIEILVKYRCLPYVMRYQDYKLSPYRGTYINLARWCNQPSQFKKKTYREFCETNGSDSACFRYAKAFEEQHPQIAGRYYDLRWS